MFGETKYPGKAADERAEREEKKTLGIITDKGKELDFGAESNSDYNAIKQAADRAPLYPENEKSEGEGFLSQDKHASPEDVVSETENDVVNAISNKMEKELEDLAIIDWYGFGEIIEKLVSSAVKKGDRQEINDIMDRTSLFIKQYEKVLRKHLPEDEEKEKVNEVFKTIMGEVVYVGDYTGEKESRSAELLKDYNQPRAARPGANKGQKIYYENNGRNAKGFLTQAEADASQKARQKARAPKPVNNVRNAARPVSIDQKEVKAYNPRTGKMESVDKN